MQTVGITVTGRVQGVFFRKYTIDAASKCGITGFVKNTNSGDVYIEATGMETAIKAFVQWCHSGSPFSKVEKVVVEELPLQNFEGFGIRY